MIAHTEKLSILTAAVPWLNRMYVNHKFDKVVRELECCGHCRTTRPAGSRMVLYTKCGIHGDHTYAVKLERASLTTAELNAYMMGV